MYINRIKNIIKRRKITQKELSELIKTSERSLGLNLKKGDMKVSTLIKISDVLEVPVKYFFEEEENYQKLEDPSVEYLTKEKENEEIKFLKTQIELKDGQIKFLQSLIKK